MKDGGPAFPALNFIVPKDLEDRHVHRLGETQGMTLRDYFAGQIIAGLMAAPGTSKTRLDGQKLRDTMATGAYALADAMLARREA